MQTLPSQIGFFRPYSWEMSNNDSRYCQWLESTFNENEFSKNLTYLMKAVHTAMEIKALEETEDEDVEFLSRYSKKNWLFIYSFRAQSFTSLMADLCQDINRGFSFNMCHN